MNTSFSSFRRLFFYMQPHRCKISAAIFCGILNNIFDILPEVLIGITINILVYKKNSFLYYWGIEDIVPQLWFLAGIVFIVLCCQALCEYFSDFLWRSVAQTIQHELRIEVYAHIQQLEMTYFDDKSPGELLTILNEDVNQLESFFDKGISDFIYFLVSVTTVACIFIYLSPLIAFVAFFPIPGIIVVSSLFQARLGKLYLYARERAGELGAHFSNNIIGIFTIKSYAAEEYELQRLHKESLEYKQAYDDSIGISAAFIPIVRIAIAFGFFVTIALGGWYSLKGILAVGSYSILVSMTQRLLWPFIYFAKSADVYKRSMASTERVFSILDTPANTYDGNYEIAPHAIKGKIEFKNISFSYPNGSKVFEDLSLLVEPGQTIGIVGATGSGKTTLIKLLLRFYEPAQGAILLDDTSTKDFKIQLLRKVFGLVSQDVFLFKATLRENIAYGSCNISDEQIYNAARIAEIHDFIQKLPYGYETIVGERGQKLSGGQRQRISIARAIVNKPPILIFDEATSSVDNETEFLIQKSLEKIAPYHTMFIIAHRLSTVRNSDTIIVLDRGNIIEHGSHYDLLQKNGLYAQLWRIQMGEK